jgi:SpoVK/Ycf46/Vps4 family AAA+-type ATPase
MTSNSNTQIDTKLQHLIHKIIKTSSSPASSPSKSPSASSSAPSSVIVPALPLSSKQILDTLLTKHREYKRKNVTVLKTSIDEILVQFAKSKKLNTGICSKSGSLVIGSNGSGNGSGNNQKKKTVSVPIGQQQRQGGAKQLGNKRKRNEDKQQQQSQQQNQQKRINNSSDDEEEYDRIAVQNDLLVQSLQIQNQANQLEGGNSGNSDSGGSSMLNANLRNRYKDVQRERDVVARKKASTVVVEEDDNDQAEKSSFLPTISEAASSDTITPTPTSRPSTPTTPQSTTRKKKKKLSRSSSSSNLNKASSEQSSSAPFTSTPRPKERYTDLGGLTKTLTQIRQLIEYPLSHPELFAHLGIDPPRGVLFRGPPGCGKTHIANAIAGQLNVTFYKISAPEIVSSMSGESESRLRDLFSIASSTAPSIIFMDEIDAIAPKRGGDGSSSGGSKGMEKRIVAQLLTCMDSLSPENNRNGSPVMVLAATNRPDSIDAALRRAGRFDREIILGVPDEEGRESILRVMTVGMRLSGDIDFKLLAKKTPGYVGADIRSLTKEAGVIAINRIFKKILIPKESLEGAKDPPSKAANNADGDTAMEESQEQEKQEKGNDKQDAKDQKQKAAEQSDDFDIHSVTRFTTEQLEPLSITMKDFLEAVPHVQPSSKREGFATVPDVSWDDIGALQCIREELTLSVLEPIANPEKFKALGLPLPAGVLLYGPPGCGKVSLMSDSLFFVY